MSETVAKARSLLAQQIEELGSLRNASTRDVQFKQWRQNTLTVIQRIWPDEPGRSERFRRVPFSPPQVRHDVRAAREHFERGCGEALEYLNLLLREMETSGLTSSSPAGKRDDSPGSFEEDYPTLELPGDTPPAAASPAAPARTVGPPPVPAALTGRAPLPPGPENFFEGSSEPLANRDEARPSSPPPSRPMRVSVRKDEQEQPDTPPAGKANPLENILSSMKAPAPSQERGGRRGRKGGRSRLKDMLGFTERDAATKPARPAAPAPGPARLPEPPARRAPEPPRAGRESTLSLPEFQVPGEPTPLTPADLDAAPSSPATPVPAPPRHPEPSRESAPARHPEPSRAPAPPRASEPPALEAPSWLDEPPPVAEAPPWMEDAAPVSPVVPPPLARRGAPRAAEPSPVPAPETLPVSAVEPRTAEPELAEPELVEPELVEPELAEPELVEPELAEIEPAGQESDDAARVTAEFLLNSPVLSSQARPVARRGAPAPAARATPLVNTSALQILQLATEIDRLGVPETQHALARLFLLDLARALEKGDVSWDSLRDAMQMVMQFPPLARRAMPVLLPYLDQAA